jgi:hypothetical protein
MTTLNEVITNALKGKSVIVYEYDALFLDGEERRYSHWYINNDEENSIPYNHKNWTDLQIKKHMGTIVSVSGNYMDYERTSISMNVMVNNENKYISLIMEETMELI